MARNQNNDVVMNVEQDIKLIKVKELLGKFQSKSAFYTMLTCHSKYRAKNCHSLVQYYLPSRRGTSLKFMRALLKGDKSVSFLDINRCKMLKVSQLKKLKIPNYPEISVKSLWDKYKEDNEVQKYFPNFKVNQHLEKAFLFDFLSTIKGDYMKKVIQSDHDARNLDKNIQNGEMIEIKPTLFAEMMETNFNSSSL